MWCDGMWCHMTWGEVMWCDVMWCDMMWCLCDVMWWNAMQCNIYVHAGLTFGAIMLALCLQSVVYYRKVRFWDANWIVPRTTSDCIWSNRATRILMFLSYVWPDLRGLHNAGFCCQACQIRMVLIMLYGIYFMKHFCIMSLLRQTPTTNGSSMWVLCDT